MKTEDDSAVWNRTPDAQLGRLALRSLDRSTTIENETDMAVVAEAGGGDEVIAPATECLRLTSFLWKSAY
jgi:hypothetical protein